MSTTVTLQEHIGMSPWPILLLVLGIGAIALLFLIPYLKNRQQTAQAPVQQHLAPPTVTAPKDKYAVKSHYMSAISAIQRDKQTGLISDRKAAAALSLVVRDFINEMTGINVQNYSLIEIKQLNMPDLAELIEDCYNPEFAKNKSKTWDVQLAIIEAKEIIRKWT